jgi:pSer/pThr/pTyr-binding forkhead associated (FHA) protein
MFRIILEPFFNATHLYQPSGESIIIDSFPFVLGRHSSCDYRLDEPQISRWHCRFVDAGTEVHVSDLESRNGTFINGLRVMAPQPVHTGDILTLGRCQFRVDVHCSLPREVTSGTARPVAADVSQR